MRQTTLSIVAARTPVREQALALGSRKSLVGILTPGHTDAPGATPAEAGAGGKPFVLILNAGIIHRVGPNRLHVLLARALAAAGYSSLRLDLSGIGDSDKRSDPLPPLESSLADVKEVVDWLEGSRGIRRFILMGLCSGADQGVLYAGDDPRIVGVVQLDPSVPRTRGFYLRHYGRRLLRPRSWVTLLRSLPRLVANLRPARQADGKKPTVYSDTLAVDSQQACAFLRDVYRKIASRQVELLTVFSADQEMLRNYPGQMLDALRGVPLGERFRLEYFPDADHSFTLEAQRNSLIALILDWLESRRFEKQAQPDAAPLGDVAPSRAA